MVDKPVSVKWKMGVRGRGKIMWRKREVLDPWKGLERAEGWSHSARRKQRAISAGGRIRDVKDAGHQGAGSTGVGEEGREQRTAVTQRCCLPLGRASSEDGDLTWPGPSAERTHDTRGWLVKRHPGHAPAVCTCTHLGMKRAEREMALEIPGLMDLFVLDWTLCFIFFLLTARVHLGGGSELLRFPSRDAPSDESLVICAIVNIYL